MVAVSLIGLSLIVTMTHSMSGGKEESSFSYVLCIVSMLLYAGYQVFFARMVPQLPRGTKLRQHIAYLTLILGMRGLYSWLIGVPMLLIKGWVTEIEPTGEVLENLFFSFCCGWLSSLARGCFCARAPETAQLFKAVRRC